MDRIDSPDQRLAIVFAGGEPVDPVLQDLLPDASYVVAADSGLDQAKSIGIEVDVVIGDLDSVKPATLAAARTAGVTVVEHPVDKDATDLELALDHTAATGYTRIIIAGGDGGRLDHLLGNALILAAPRYEGLDLEWWVGTTRVLVAGPGAAVEIAGSVGDRVSLLAVGGDAIGVTTRNLRWTLDGESLHTGSTRGISNELVAAPARISIEHGRLLVIHERNPR